jgi:hypothetical protein
MGYVGKDYVDRRRPSTGRTDNLRNRERIRRLQVDKIRPEETLDMLDEEYQMLYFLYARNERFGYWKILNALASQRDSRIVVRNGRRRQMALLQRLITEKKIYRNCRLCEVQLMPIGIDRIRELACVNPITH